MVKKLSFKKKCLKNFTNHIVGCWPSRNSARNMRVRSLQVQALTGPTVGGYTQSQINLRLKVCI